MKFVVDEQLAPAIAAWLNQSGHEAEHVHAKGLGGAADRDIWDQCAQAGAVIITKDRDFVIRRAAVPGPSVVWVRLGNLRTGELMRRFRYAWPMVEAKLADNASIIELS